MIILLFFKMLISLINWESRLIANDKTTDAQLSDTVTIAALPKIDLGS